MISDEIIIDACNDVIEYIKKNHNGHLDGF